MVDHTRLAKDRLVEVLFALSRIETPVPVSDQTVGNDPLSVAVRIQAEFIDFKAEQLLGPPFDGPLFSPEDVRPRLIKAAQMMGSAGSLPRNVMEAIFKATVNFMVVSGTCWDPSETYERAWRSVRALCDVAAVHHLPPTRFMSEVPVAHDWVIRLAFSPHEFLQMARGRLDLLHPDELGRHLQVFAHAVKVATQGIPGLEEIPVIVAMPYKLGNDYWQWRAQRLQHVEREIARIWGGVEE